RDLMFVFDNLADIDDRAMQTVLRDIPNDKLAIALRGADQKVKDKITEIKSSCKYKPAAAFYLWYSYPYLKL
ncbi:MAG TPA: FliG C-terminal domain-containing protein, partial [Pontibacter sp.]